MRIDRISVQNFLAISDVSAGLQNLVTLIAGPNGSGKSSLRDAIIYCATGETSRVKLKKKDYPELLHPGARRGEASLMMNGVTYTRALPSGNFSSASFDPPAGWQYLLDPAAFLRLSMEDRRKVLFQVTGTSMTVAATLTRLAERGYAENMRDQISPLLRQGFDAGVVECQGMARGVKGRWRQLTGRDWGSKLAADWTDPGCAASQPESPGAAEARIRDLQARISGIDQQIGMIRHDQLTRDRRAAEKTEAARKANDLEKRIAARRGVLSGEGVVIGRRNEALIAFDQAERVVTKAQNAIVAAMAQGAPDGSDYNYICAACGNHAVLIYDGMDDRYVDTRTKVSKPELDPRLTGALAEAEAGLKDARSTLEGLNRDLDEFKSNRQALEVLVEAQRALCAPVRDDESDLPDPTLGVDLPALEQERQILAIGLTDAMAQRDRLSAARRNLDAALSRTKEAAALHAQIELWIRLADDLSPSGIPAELLRNALDPINASLLVSGKALGFVSLELTPEMEVLGRPAENDPVIPRRYELLSESARWRIEAAMADAIGRCLEIGGQCLPVVLDRFECLDGGSRSKVIKWLLSLERQSILLGTLKHRDIPETLPEGLAICWLSAGTLEIE